tara:strand:+ start:384 stop:629 length:246 start_codon:yes stop_codon:yes gene_type:complete
MIFIIRLVCTALVLSGIIFIPNAFAENVPSWIKNNAGWWATDKIDDTSFLQGIQYLIKEGIMVYLLLKQQSQQDHKKFRRG